MKLNSMTMTLTYGYTHLFYQLHLIIINKDIYFYNYNKEYYIELNLIRIEVSKVFYR